MAHYAPLDEGQIKEIALLYGLESIKSISGVESGISNSNYRLEGERENYILKLAQAKPIQDLKDELVILSYLKDQNFRYVVAPKRTREGSLFFSYHEHHGSLYPLAQGELATPSLNIVDEMGSVLGELHAKFPLEKIESKIRNYQQVGSDLECLLEFLPNAPEDYKKVFEQLDSEHIALYRDSSLPKGLIHGDAYLDNALFNGQFLRALLDFEQAGAGRFLLDIGISLSDCCLKDQKINKDLICSFLAGYQVKRTLEAEEMELIPFSIALGFLSIAHWRIQRFENRDYAPEMKGSYQELLKKAEDFLNEQHHFKNLF